MRRYKAEQSLAQKQLWRRGALLYRRQRVAELGGFLLQVLQLALAETFVILGGTDIMVGDLVFKHVIDGTGSLMRRRHERLGWPQSPFQPSVEGPKRAVGTDDCVCRHAEGLGGTGAIFHRAALEDLAAGEVMLGSQTQPGAAVFVIGPLVHVCADLRENGLGKGITDPVHGHEVHPRDAEDMGARVDLRGVLTRRVGLTPWGRRGLCGCGHRGGGLEARLDHGKGVLNLRIAGADLSGVEIKQREGWREDEPMFGAPSAGQRQRDFIRILCTTLVPQRGTTTRVTLASDNSADDALSGNAWDSAQRLGQLDIHL